MALDKILRAIALATFLGSLCLLDTHIYTHQRARTHTRTALTQSVRSSRHLQVNRAPFQQ